ncbi:hypothetical protein [Halosegnis longus]|uniref:Uncharacterized protein n=1 Tax=Halosegnis longus TaxID=2216012 RepID=A0AAJ4RA16_9EURY|nr:MULTISPECIES: hypothetical protein [Halobacteriales]RNJ26982.1 hypothetical protein Nmn1133_10000 [Salella cibi]
MADSPVFSHRAVRAGFAAGGSAFLAVVGYLLWNVGQVGLRGTPLAFLAVLVTPVITLSVATLVWRVGMPDEPTPVYGAIAGAATAAVSISLFRAFIGVLASITDGSASTLAGSVSEAISFAGSFAVYGGLFTLPVVVPLGALLGYGYEWYVARTQP